MEPIFSKAYAGKGIRKPPVDGKKKKIQTSKKTLTPNEKAILKLKSFLERKVQTQGQKEVIYLLNLSAQEEYIPFLKDSSVLRFMNMAILAKVLIFLYSVNNNVTSENFKYKSIERLYMDDIFNDLGVKVNEIDNNELEIMKLRLAATFLRYIKYVLRLIESKENIQEQ